jgi:phage terminase large subunit-like protein
MAEFMKEDFRLIYDNPAGTRRAIISRGRKNAKSTEAALILLLHLCGTEARPNSQLFSAAQSRDQAALIFGLAAKMVRLSPSLSAFVGVRDTIKQLYCNELGTLYRALSAEVSTAFGLNPSLVIHDEAGQIRGPRSPLYEALETATAAQEAPLSILISTQAATDSDLLSILIDDAKAGHDPRTVLRFDTAPINLDPFSEEAIRAANPAFDLFMNRDEVLSMAADARRMPARQAEYENLILNRRIEANSPFVSSGVWQGCADMPLPLDDVAVYGGLDLSSARDLTALVLIGERNGVWQVHPTFWLPGDGLAEKSRADREPYDLWHQQGYLQTTPSRSIEYEYIAEYMRGIFDQYTIRKIAFDAWGWEHLKPWMLKAGFTEDVLTEHFVEFRQGFKSMSPALRTLESDLLNEKFAHGNHPVLTMNAANAVVQIDPAGNRKLSKDKSPGRIDGMVALAMARGIASSDIADALDVLSMVA